MEWILESVKDSHNARAAAIVAFVCTADDGLFGEWESLSDEAKQEFANNGAVPCDGSGYPGEWCARCRFGDNETIVSD